MSIKNNVQKFLLEALSLKEWGSGDIDNFSDDHGDSLSKDEYEDLYSEHKPPVSPFKLPKELVEDVCGKVYTAIMKNLQGKGFRYIDKDKFAREIQQTIREFYDGDSR